MDYQDSGVDECTSQVSKFYAYVTTSNDWLNKRVKIFLRTRLPEIVFISTLADFPLGKDHLIQFACHELGNLDVFNRHFQAGKHSLVNAFPNMEALARKDYLAEVANYWVAKRENTVLKGHVPVTIVLDVDYAEWLDDSLAEADSFDLCASMERNKNMEPCKRDWWIFKPAMCDCGYGIQLFSTKDELSRCLQSIEDVEDDLGEATVATSSVPTSILRKFVAQQYIMSPRMLQGKKFHIRSYAMGLGRLKVFVYREMLVLMASKAYQPPWIAKDPYSHLTNTSINGRLEARHFWDIEEHLMPATWKRKVFEQICQISGEIFLAAARSMASRFNIVNGAFELFGLDFLIDTSGAAWLLEVNAGPAYHDKDLSSRLLDAVVYTALKQTLEDQMAVDNAVEKSMIQVLDEDFGKSNIEGIWLFS